MSDSRGRSVDDREHGVLDFLPYYEMGTLKENERRALESHALECDVCFAEMARGSAAFRLLRERAQEARRLLASGEARRTGFVRGFFRARWVVPVTAAAGLAVGLWMLVPRSPDPRDLASFPPLPPASSALRSPGISEGTRELLDAGSAYLELGRTADAERSFAAAWARDPNSFEAAYGLGLARAHGGNTREAVVPLERSLALAPPQDRPRATWVLANAYLAEGRLDEARHLLTTLAGGADEHAGKAADLLGRMRR